MALVGDGVGNLIDDSHHQHADEAASRIALLFGTACAGAAFPQQLAGAQIHQAGAGGDHSLAGDDQIAGAVVLDVEVQRGIGTVDLVELLDGQGMNVRRLGHPVLPEGLVGDRHRQHVIAGLGERVGDLGLQAGPRLDIRRVIHRWQHQDGGRSALLEVAVVVAGALGAAAQQQGAQHQGKESAQCHWVAPFWLDIRKFMKGADSGKRRFSVSNCSRVCASLPSWA
ncbi:hypothetical protein D3C84_423340 [compost metagenome]